MSKQLFVILDHNYTLVANSHEKRQPFAEQIRREVYRQWLVELLRPHHVMLVTGRPAKYRNATLESIRRKTNWEPQEAYFNDRLALSLNDYKYHVLADCIWPKHGKDAPYLAVESGSLVRAMWTSHGIAAIAAPLRGEVWDKLPIPPHLKQRIK